MIGARTLKSIRFDTLPASVILLGFESGAIEALRAVLDFVPIRNPSRSIEQDNGADFGPVVGSTQAAGRFETYPKADGVARAPMYRFPDGPRDSISAIGPAHTLVSSPDGWFWPRKERSAETPALPMNSRSGSSAT
jgi:hypothetical protein